VLAPFVKPSDEFRFPSGRRPNHSLPFCPFQNFPFLHCSLRIFLSFDPPVYIFSDGPNPPPPFPFFSDLASFFGFLNEIRALFRPRIDLLRNFTRVDSTRTHFSQPPRLLRSVGLNMTTLPPLLISFRDWLFFFPDSPLCMPVILWNCFPSPQSPVLCPDPSVLVSLRRPNLLTSRFCRFCPIF